MYKEKRILNTFYLTLYLPVHLFVQFFIGIVEKELFGENGISWNVFILSLSVIDVLVCFSIFRRVRESCRNHEGISFTAIALLCAYNAELIIEVFGSVLQKFVENITMNAQFYFTNVPSMTMVFHFLWGIISVLTVGSLLLAISSKFGS